MLAPELLRPIAAEIADQLDGIGRALKIDALQAELSALKTEQQKPDFWLDQKTAQQTSRRAKFIEDTLQHYSRLQSRASSAADLIDLAAEAADEALLNDVSAELENLQDEVSSLHIETLLSGKYDYMNAILTLHAGAGGTEAQDWVSMLYRMYVMYAEKRGFKTAELDSLAGDEAGLKSVTFSISGENAYGYLKAEKGVHRLVRISPFDSNKRRHTSFASLEVMPELDNSAADNIIIDERDLRVDTYRSSGAGGQHVNKTESAIRITHAPTGIVVACQNERSQIQNREQAMQMLKSKLAEKAEREQMEEAAAIKGDIKKIEWGSQIRSYVFMPYTLVKDHRTGCENSNIFAVMDGDIQAFIETYLQKTVG